MKKIMLVAVCFHFSFSAQAFYHLSELNQAMQEASLDGLSEWENAYGSFDASQAEVKFKQGIQTSDHEIGRLVLEMGDNRLSQKQLYEVNQTIDQLASQTDAYTQDYKEETTTHQQVTKHQCYESNQPELIVVTRSLDIEVSGNHEKIKEDKCCLGHQKEKHFFYKSEAKEKEKSWKEKYSKDSTIKRYHIDFDGSILYGYDVVLTYKHKKNQSNCDHFKIDKQLVQSNPKEIIKEQWVDEQESYQTLLRDPEVTFIQKQCIDTTPSKIINGLLVERPCWKEQYAFLRKKAGQSTDCDAYRQKNCQLLSSKCIQGSEQDCQLWELTFECIDQLNFSPNANFNPDSQNEEIDSVEPNTSFNEVVAKLSIFKAMKDELASSQSLDPSQIEIFKGSKKQCNKSIASNAIYDCCFSYSGLAKQVGLAKCDADEIALAGLREEGLCHYIGMKENQLLDLITTNYTHVFCCFPTKLARVLNEQGKKQLHIGWGDAEHPNCQGLTIEQIQQLDFDQLKLDEVFEKNSEHLNQWYTDKTKNLKDSSQSQAHIDAIKKKMTDKLQAIHEN